MSQVDANPLDRDDDLDRLVRDIIERQPSDVEWPRDEVVHAYVTGTSTDSEREQVLAVLSQSPEFRQFVIDTSLRVRQLQSSHTQDQFDELATRPQPRVTPRTDSLVDSLWEWLSSVIKPRVLAPVAGIAAIVALALLSPWSDTMTPGVRTFGVETILDRETFTVLVNRDAGPSPSSDQSAHSARQAAVQSLQQCVRYDMDSDQIKLIAVPEEDALPTASSGIEVVVRGAAERPVRRVRFALPQSAANRSAGIRAWLMVPPSLRLWSTEMSISDTLIWPDATSTRGCLTVTYKEGTEFHALPAREVSFSDIDRQ